MGDVHIRAVFKCLLDTWILKFSLWKKVPLNVVQCNEVQCPPLDNVDGSQLKLKALCQFFSGNVWCSLWPWDWHLVFGMHCSWGWLIDLYVLTIIKILLMIVIPLVRANNRWCLTVLWWIFLCKGGGELTQPLMLLVRKWNNVLLIWTLVSVVYRQTFISGRK